MEERWNNRGMKRGDKYIWKTLSNITLKFCSTTEAENIACLKLNDSTLEKKLLTGIIPVLSQQMCGSALSI